MMATFNLFCKSKDGCKGHRFISYEETLEIINNLQKNTVAGMISATELKRKLEGLI